ncbi:MAG: hypothetical protein ACI81L_002675 [Verrucomicrobiales bacterium]|jgi:hypothetical protein
MIRLVAFCFVLLGLSACTDDAPSQTEFNEQLDGVPSDQESFDLEVVSCVNDGEFVRYTWRLSNLSDERRTFAFDPYFTDLKGKEEKAPRELVGESVDTGAYVQWDGGVGGGERFPIGDVECRFEVVDSVLGAFRDEG